MIPVARLEEIHEAIDLFQELEERGLLTVEYLVQLLSSIGCSQLLDGLEKDAVSNPPRKTTQYEFTECLVGIAQRLTPDEIKILSFKWSLSSSHQVASGRQFLLMLQRKSIIGPNNLKELFDEFLVISRSDLCREINHYLARTRQAPYDLPKNELPPCLEGMFFHCIICENGYYEVHFLHCIPLFYRCNDF